ncbi:MAG: transposase, partial [Pseudomonadota bacterium]
MTIDTAVSFSIRCERSRKVPSTRAAFLVPGRALSRLFRAKVRTGLRKAGLLDHTPPAVWRKEWVVHVQHAGTGAKVLDYLARYVFRIAIVNSRLERFADGHVTFRYRDGR